MLSGGGVASASTAARHGSWTVLSGPAGGAVGAARSAERAGSCDVVCLDMGGTSCDVSVAFGGRARETGGREVGGRALALPMVDVHTIGAGGGSVAWRDAGGALRASGVLSALGLIVSERRRDFVESVLLEGEEIAGAAEAVARLAVRGRDELAGDAADVRVGYDLRYAGQAFEITIAGAAQTDADQLRREFDAAHEQRY